MSDQEFENYLTLIGRLLRLSHTQRQAIGEELRDHFESRVSEQTGRGMQHAEAIRMALEEFGDAAGLAAHFSSIAQTRKRRIIMRCTVGSIAALATALVIALSLWPDSHAPKAINRAVADTPEKPKAEAAQKDLDKLSKAAQELPDDLTARTEAELNGKFVDLEFTGQPLTEVFEYINQRYSIGQYYIDYSAMKDVGFDPTTTLVTESFKNTRLRTALNLMLSNFDLGYTIHDGILIFSTKEKLDATLETRVYDCRQILSADSGEFRAPDSRKNQKTEISATPSVPAYGGPGMGPPIAKDRPPTPADDLMDVIQTSVQPQTWTMRNGHGTICEFDGLLIVNATAAVQSDVVDLLDKISSRLKSRAAN
jgi:hypothetical protein